LKKKESLVVKLIIGLWLIFSCIFVYNFFFEEDKADSTQSLSVVPVPEKLFGFEKDDYVFETHSLDPDKSLGELLVYQGISWDSILKLDKISEEIFSIRRFRAKKPFTLVKEDSCSSPTCLIYEPNKLSYIKYHLKDKVDVDIVRKNYELCEESASGEIKSSLWMAMKDAEIGFDLINQMEDAMASDVDFYHTYEGDQFKLVYERKYIDGEPVGYGDILAASYKDRNGESFAVYYENENYSGFYDLKGQPAKKTFLRSPVKRSYISSGYNPRRFHPIKKRRIPHLGTDYAAPTGTPIYAVANGVIEQLGYTKGNGKYIKIKHDEVYKTQYLHMSRFAKGMKKGVPVQQEQVIGYVGQTGLATGPHVCFRFWKNGRQVNHLKENFPPKDPLPQEEMPEFFRQRDILIAKLDQVPYPGEEEAHRSQLVMTEIP